MDEGRAVGVPSYAGVRDRLLGAVDGGLPGPWQPATTDDVREAGQQLGRPALGVVAVAARCRFGRPMVIVNHPVVRRNDGQVVPFPTTFWLTCPYLVAAVSTLESEGWIRHLAARARRELAFAERLRRAHAGASALRRALAGAEGLAALERTSPGARARVEEGGVAGIRHPLGIKCLHAHLADHLGRGGNPVGAVVLEALRARGIDPSGDPSCPAERALEKAGELP